MSKSVSLPTLKRSLSSLSTAVLSLSSEDKTFHELWGFTYPMLTRHDLSYISKQISKSLEILDESDVNEELENLFGDINAKVTLLQSGVIPYFFSGNSHTISAVEVYVQTFTVIRSLLDPYIGYEIVASKDMMPKSLSKKIKGIEGRINSLSPDMESLEAKIFTINEASDAADSLPTDLEELKKAREQVDAALKSIEASKEKIQTLESTSSVLARFMEENKEISEKSIKKIDEHLRMATTNGLASAFSERAKELKYTVWFWVILLAGSLMFGMTVAHANLSALTESLSSGNTNSIAVNVVFTLLSVGGSVWFAWISTKQIGQRFRLAEDYAYKASVAMAYEGYRQEAVRIDDVFEARLFASTLTRLEEAPLRLIEDTTHGSPFHELFNSEGFKKALEAIPEFKRDIIGLLKKDKSDEPTENVAEKPKQRKSNIVQEDE